MTRLIPVTLVVAMAWVGGTGRAADTDAINAEIDKAKKARQQADAKARTALLAAFDDAIKAVAASGDLDGVKAVQAEKKAFEESGKVPDLARLRTAAAEYQKATRAAQAAMEKVYEQGIKDATKALNIDLAEAIRSELKGMQGKAAKNAEKSRPETVKAKSDNATAKWVPGTYAIHYMPNSVIRTYVVKANGAVNIKDEMLEGQLKPYGSGGSFTLDVGDGKIERLTFADGRVFVEHFSPKSNFGMNPPSSIGIGELAKKK